MRGYRQHGNRVWLVVGRKRGDDPHVLVIPEDRRPFYRMIGYPAVQVRLRRLAGRYPNSGWGLAGRVLRLATHPWVLLNQWRGLEDFDFPGSYEVLDMLDTMPDVAQCHNLHGGYFDLRAIQWLSRRVPTVLTLHDMWLLTGHCAYSLACDRWKTGCGHCPDLNLDPAVRADATAGNHRRKAAIYSQSHLNVATPSQWLMDNVKRSILAPAIGDARVIHNGVDLDTFHPADKHAVRAALDIPPDIPVVLLTAGSLGSMWKDDGTLLRTVERMTQGGGTLLFIALGRESAVPRTGSAHVRSVPYQSDPRVVAQYYQAADLYLHAAHADTFPLTVLEAMACGTPVVATDVGGIPEQIRSADLEHLTSGSGGDLQGATGVLVPPRDAARMAQAVLALLASADVRRQMGGNAVCDARARFSIDRQVAAYLEWYREIIQRRPTPSSPAESRCAAPR